MLMRTSRKSRIEQQEHIVKMEDYILKKELFPQSRDPPTAMIDPDTGSIVTDDEAIQKIAVETYTKRLQNKPIKKNL